MHVSFGGKSKFPQLRILFMTITTRQFLTFIIIPLLLTACTPASTPQVDTDQEEQAPTLTLSPTETIPLTETLTPTATAIPPTPTFPAPEGADLPDSAVRSVNEQGREVILDQPGGEPLWTLVEDEHGDLAWQKTETIQEKISVSLPAADYSAVVAETRKAIEEGELTHEQALEYWQPVLELHFAPELVGSALGEVSSFAVDESGLMVLKTEQGQNILRQEADGTSFMVSREFLEQNTELCIGSFPYYFAFLPHVPFSTAEDIYEASLEGEAAVQAELGRYLTTIQGAYNQLVANLERRDFTVLGLSSTGSLVLEKDGERFYFEEAMEATNASGITAQERREADLEQGIMYDVVTIVSEKTEETEDYVPGKSGLKLVFRGPEAFKFSSDDSEPQPAELVRVDDEEIAVLYKNMVAEILAAYPEFDGYEIVHNLSPERADEMVKMEAEEVRREWSPNSWRHFNSKNAQFIDAENNRVEIKAVAAQGGQEADTYYPLSVMMTLTEGLAHIIDSDGRPIVTSGFTREAAEDVVSRADEKTNDELGRYLVPFVVESK
jgi:hypothetical protein